ncbi:hypothetical protein [Massilia endophytica]|uniref:hypothetical protein n=1 Tax=Massilia endophytica TaxID=2899220 RepID=UPI001E4945BA|nr:hypothetical protein [Massilia endophytica]UGQ46565.1 hypothetical protein LSQ66_22820 [Massilia endophytica]
MNDEDFLRQLGDCTLPPQHFNHLGHVRLAWLNLRRRPFGQAVQHTCGTIRNYATHLGASGKFHCTVTTALVHLLREAGACRPDLDWEGFLCEAAPLLADARGRLSLHYSEGVLASEAARQAFVPPDRAPLP